MYDGFIVIHLSLGLLVLTSATPASGLTDPFRKKDLTQSPGSPHAPSNSRSGLRGFVELGIHGRGFGRPTARHRHAERVNTGRALLLQVAGQEAHKLQENESGNPMGQKIANLGTSNTDEEDEYSEDDYQGYAHSSENDTPKLPEGWTAETRQGQAYYRHPATGQWQWEFPTEEDTQRLDNAKNNPEPIETWSWEGTPMEVVEVGENGETVQIAAEVKALYPKRVPPPLCIQIDTGFAVNYMWPPFSIGTPKLMVSPTVADAKQNTRPQRDEGLQYLMVNATLTETGDEPLLLKFIGEEHQILDLARKLASVVSSVSEEDSRHPISGELHEDPKPHEFLGHENHELQGHENPKPHKFQDFPTQLQSVELSHPDGSMPNGVNGANMEFRGFE